MKKRNRKSPWMLFFILLMIFSLMLFVTSCGSNDENVEENNEELETDVDEEQDTDNNEENEDTSDEVDDTENNDESDDEDNMSEEDISSLLSDLNEPDEYYYEQTIVTGDYNSSQKFWFKGENMKIEGEQEGIPYILIWTEDFMSNLDPESKTAYRSMNVEDTEEEYAESPNDFGDTDDFDFENDESFKYLGKETINGEPCYVIESTFTEDNTLSKLWIHEEHGIVMKTEVTGGTEEMNAVMEVSNLKIGGISDDEFTIPDEYEIFDY